MTLPTLDAAADRLTREDILSWPKAELHCHLDGSLRLSTVLDLARKQGKLNLLPADSEEALWKVLEQIDHSETLEAYLSWFRYTIPLMQSRESLRRIAYELVEDNARENVRYLEIRFAPILHTEESLSLEDVIDAVLDGMRAAENDFDIRTGLIVCGLRDRFESASMRQAELAATYRNKGVIAFDLAGGEAGNPPKHHLHAFYVARNRMLNLTIHAGESWGPDSIAQALFWCGAHRIGHGTSLYQDPDLMQFVTDHQIPLEICPTSNVQTHVVNGYDTHPIRIYAEEDVPVTVNTDNRLFSRTTATEELWRVHTLCGVPADQIRHIVVNGFRHAFMPWQDKVDAVRDVTRRIYGEDHVPEVI